MTCCLHQPIFFSLSPSSMFSFFFSSSLPLDFCFTSLVRPRDEIQWVYVSNFDRLLPLSLILVCVAECNQSPEIENKRWRARPRTRERERAQVSKTKGWIARLREKGREESNMWERKESERARKSNPHVRGSILTISPKFNIKQKVKKKKLHFKKAQQISLFPQFGLSIWQIQSYILVFLNKGDIFHFSL